MSSDAEDEIPRETSAAAEQQGSGTALKASLAVLGLLFCFGVGLVGETYFREWRAKPPQVTAQLPQSEEPRSPELIPKPASAPPAETKLAAAAKPAVAAAPPRQVEPPRPAAAAGGGASAPSTASIAAATGHEMNPAEPSAATAATLAALTPTAQPDTAPPAITAAAPAAPPAAKTKPAVKAAHAATKPPTGTVPATAAAGGPLRYRVQFGAFAIEDNAQSLRRAIETPKLRISIERTADSSGRLLYHVRSPAFVSYNEALNAIREAQDAAKRAQFGEAVEHVIQKVSDSEMSPDEQARIQAAQSANH